ncbi:hypothetical protein HDU78_007703 [Chytriomyces hyalinus]|nr:hypothetical protein HDU78_007703 [Chytriomyces hyalinus]
MSSCQSAYGSFAAVNQDAFGRAGSAAKLDGSYVCEQQVMDTLAAYQNAFAKDQVRTLTRDYSDTQSLQSFCLQKKGILLAIPADPPSPVQTTDQQSPVQSPIQTLQPADPSVQVNPAQPRTLQPTNAVGGERSGTALPSAGVTSSVTAGNGRLTASAAAPTSTARAVTDGTTDLYTAIGITVGVATLLFVGVVVAKERWWREQTAIRRSQQMPNPYTEQPYIMQEYTNSPPALVPPVLNVPSVAGGIRTSGSQLTGAGDDRSSTKNAFTAPIRAPALDERSSMMNAAYAARSTPTISSSRQRDSLLSDGSNMQHFNTVASHAVSMDQSSVPLPPVSTTSDPNEWTAEEVEAWARSLPHFGDKLGNIMLEYQINGRVLMGLDRNAMRDELGLVFGEVSQLEADIAQLRGDLPVQEEGLPPVYVALNLINI